MMAAASHRIDVYYLGHRHHDVVAAMEAVLQYLIEYHGLLKHHPATPANNKPRSVECYHKSP